MCDIPNPIKSNNVYKEERENNNLNSFNNLNNKLFNFNEKSELSTLYTKNYNSLSQFNKKKIYYIMIKIITLLNIENNIIKIFGLDKLVIPILIILKKWISNNIPIINCLIFKDKLSSITINYTHYSSTYYNQTNPSSNEQMQYRSLVEYIYSKKIKNAKFTNNLNSNLLFFDSFDEIQINNKIWLISKITVTSSSTVYILELFSYNSRVNVINQFISNCVEKYKNNINKNSLIKSNIKYFRYIGLNNNSQAIFDELSVNRIKTFDNIFFEGKNKIIKQILHFINNEKEYYKLGIPWTMGFILYGPAGVGKTSFIKAIANLTDRNILDIPLPKIKNSSLELKQIFHSIKINGVDMPNRNRIYVLDEFDLILDQIIDRRKKNEYEKFNNKKNIQNKQYKKNNYINDNDQNEESEVTKFSLNDLLTLLDGIIPLHGCIFIATTNFIHLIDKALKRPGRFDYIINLEYASTNIIIEIIQHFASKSFKRNINSDNHNKQKKKVNSDIDHNKIMKLTDVQIEFLEKYSKYNSHKLWSPAKLCQLCLQCINDDDFINSVLKEIESQYGEECKKYDEEFIKSEKYIKSEESNKSEENSKSEESNKPEENSKSE